MRRVLSVAVLVLAAGCLEQPRSGPLPRMPSLYTRLGGEKAVAKVADQALAGLEVSAPDVKRLARELGAALGGPQESSARGLVGVAADLGLAPQELARRLDEAVAASGADPDVRAEVKEVVAQRLGVS